MTLQKRHTCFTISEAYKLFCDKNPAVKILHTSFYNQKPGFTWLQAEKPVHNCLRTYHKNMPLLISAALLISYNPNCMMQNCETCKNLSLWHEFTKEILDENDLKQLCYAQWDKKTKWSTQREKLSHTTADVIDLITSKLEFFLYHDFVKNAEAKSFHNQKNDLAKNEVILSLWFQWKLLIYSTRWNTKWSLGSSMLDTVYCLNSLQRCKWLSSSWIICSCIWLYELWQICSIGLPVKNFDEFKNLYPNITITKKYFRSDGAGQHFKQKYTVCSMSLMKEETEWNFSAISHGKGDTDGLGGTCKQHIRKIKSTHYWFTGIFRIC